MKKWIIGLVVTIMFLAGVYLLIMYQLGDRIFNEIIEQQLAHLEQLEKEFSDTGSINSDENVDNASNQTSPQPSIEKKSPVNEGGSAAGPTGDIKETDAGKDGNEEKVPIVITREKLESAKVKITASDKVTVANFLLKKLTKEDVNELTSMLSRGLTAEDKKRAKEIAYARFTKEEIETVIELYTKYME